MTSINQRAAEWLCRGETGQSSVAIFVHMIADGPIRIDKSHHPHDPYDLNRCLVLLAAVPEWSDRMLEMAEHGPYWAALAPRWAELQAVFEKEIGGPSGYARMIRAPKTYALMKEILRPIEDADASVVRLGEGVTLRVGD